MMFKRVWGQCIHYCTECTLQLYTTVQKIKLSQYISYSYFTSLDIPAYGLPLQNCTYTNKTQNSVRTQTD